MSFAGPDFVLAIIALSTSGWVLTTWIRARHGYAVEDEWGGKTSRAVDDAAARLAEENRELRGDLGSVTQRLQVLERIVTDKGYDTAVQIEALRDARPVLASAPGAAAATSETVSSR